MQSSGTAQTFSLPIIGTRISPAMAGSLASLVVPGGLLLGAYAFQYLGGLVPCEMCLWQRMPHMALAALGLALLAVPAIRGRGLLGVATLIAAVSVGLALWHVGVEQHWWPSPVGCSATIVTGSVAQIAAQILQQPVVYCDQPQWHLFGLSMAGWNGVVSLGLAGFLAACTWRTR